MAVDAKSINIHMQVTGPFPAQMAVAGASVQTFGNQANAGMAKAQSGMAKFGAVASKVGAVSAIGLAIGLGLSAKAAIDFESSFAGVRKTVEATEPQFQRLKDGIRGLAREIPIGVNELNRIAELGGQLGVEQGGILQFADTIAKIGVTTTLTTEAAATGFARLDNIMGLNQTRFENIGSAIVDLGNNFAATEDEILNFALRIAPIGATLGVLPDQVLAIATAFTSVGIPAERGGTAVQKTFLAISNAADLGGPKLALFAELTGRTTDEFKELVKADPGQAFQEFINGLGEVIRDGGNASIILKDLDLNNARVVGSLLALANAEGVLDEAMMRSNSAYEDQIALNEEAEKRFETTKSKLILLKNQFVDTAIVIGTQLLPAINDLIAGFGEIFEFLTTLPTAVGLGVAAFGGLAAAIFLLNKHPVILALTGVAFLIGNIGKAAERSKRQTDLLREALERTDPHVTRDELGTLLNETDLNLLANLGFSSNQISEAIFDGGDKVLDQISIALKNRAFNDLDEYQRGELEAEAYTEGYEGKLIDYFIEAGTFGRTAGLIGRIEGLKTKQQTIQGEVAAELLLLQERDFTLGRGGPGASEREEHRVRGGLLESTAGETSRVFGQFVELSEDQLGDVTDATNDYRDAFIDAFNEIDERIMGQVSLWYEFGDAVEFNIDEMITSLIRQVGAVIGFETFFQNANLPAEVEAIFREAFGSTPALQEAFVEWVTIDPEAAQQAFADTEAALDPLAGLVGSLFEAMIPDLEALHGVELLSALEEIVDAVLEDPGNYDPIAAWISVLEASETKLGPEMFASLKDLIVKGLASPAVLEALGLELGLLNQLLEALGLFPTEKTIKFFFDVPPLPLLPGHTFLPPEDQQTVTPPQPKQAANAFGGNIMGGQPTVVGEYGPELFVPFSNGNIMSNDKLGGGGDTNIEVNVIRPETSDLAGDISEGLTRASIAQQVDLIGSY